MQRLRLITLFASLLFLALFVGLGASAAEISAAPLVAIDLSADTPNPFAGDEFDLSEMNAVFNADSLPNFPHEEAKSYPVQSASPAL